MKNVRSLLFLAVGVVILGGVAGVMIAKRHAGRDAALQAFKVAGADLAQARSEAQWAAVPAVTSAAPATPDVVPQEASTPPEDPQQLKPVKATGQTNSTPQRAVAQASQGGPPAKEPLRDPMARVARAFVGMDADAEAYWYGAINNPSLPAKERQDLIEDLNEEGLSDPRRPTADDLPLIVSRLLIIEEVGPGAMDEVNADAFQEAYKDLVTLANLARGSGPPVR